MLTCFVVYAASDVDESGWVAQDMSGAAKC